MIFKEMDIHSPFDGQTVEGIEGIVTYSFTLTGSTYYHIQTPDALADKNPNTSEAIVLYSGNKRLANSKLVI